jgi:hypothetical protein
MGYGMGSHLGICFQESFGTSYTSSMHYFPLITESLAEAIPPLQIEGLRGRFESGGVHEGPHSIAGDIIFEGHPILLGIALKACLGQSSGFHVMDVSDYYVHTFKPRPEDFDAMAAVPPMTIEAYRDAGSSHLYSDCLCNQLVIEVAYGAIQKCTMSVIGGSFEKLAKTTPSYLTGSEFIWDQASISIADTAIDELSTFTLTLNNALEGKGTIDGTKTFNRIKRAGFRVAEIAGTLLFDNDDEFDNFRNKTNQAVVVTTEGGVVGGGISPRASTLKMDFPKAKYREFPVNIAGPGLIEASFTADCLYKTTSATMMELTLVNTQESY